MKNLKKIFVFVFLSFSVYVGAQEYCMTAPIGYGAGTTGGGNVTPVVVTNYADLRTNLISGNAKVILVSGTITFPEDANPISVKSNKTLIGLPGAKLQVYPVPQANRKSDGSGSGLLDLGSGTSNIIIRNLIFQGPGAWDTDTGRDLLSNNGCNKLWVDHCEFYDGMDGNFDNTKKSDNITISWCKFGYSIATKTHVSPGTSDNHRFSNLVGGGDSDAPDDGQYSITFQYCYWASGCAQRMPRARNAQLHVLNCYYNNSGNPAIGLGAGNVGGTTCYVENCNFKAIGKVSDTSYAGNKTTVLTFVGCTGKATTNKGTAAKPTYAYTAIAASAVEAAVTGTCGAGATLSVTTAGVISSSCNQSTAIEEVEDVKLRIVQTADEISVSGAADIAQLTLYTLAGTRATTAKNEPQINIATLPKGVYVLLIETADGAMASEKIIKR